MNHIKSIEIFIAVADTGSFSGAARATGLSPPSVTRGINALEARLGTRLFTRTTRSVRLTEVGEVYLDSVRQILVQLQAADDAASGASTNPVGKLRITCPSEFGRIYIVPIVTEFLDVFPGVTVDVVMVERVVNIVEEGFDIALRIGQLPSSGLSAVRVGSVRPVVCGAPAYFEAHGTPESPSALAQHKIVLAPPWSSASDWVFGHDSRAVARFSSRLTVSSVASGIEVARSGWGLCRALSYQVAADVERGALHTVLEDFDSRLWPVHLVHVEGRRAAAKVRSFIDFAKERLRSVPALQPKTAVAS